jgi:hypothetical protein
MKAQENTRFVLIGAYSGFIAAYRAVAIFPASGYLGDKRWEACLRRDGTKKEKAQ